MQERCVEAFFSVGLSSTSVSVFVCIKLVRGAVGGFVEGSKCSVFLPQTVQFVACVSKHLGKKRRPCFHRHSGSR